MAAEARLRSGRIGVARAKDVSAPVIPFNRPAIMGRELEYIGDAVARGHTSGDGAYTKTVSYTHLTLPTILRV